MKIGFVTVVKWLVANWSTIGQLIALAVELVTKYNALDASGKAKATMVSSELKAVFPDMGNAVVNVVVELVVNILRWRGVLK